MNGLRVMVSLGIHAVTIVMTGKKIVIHLISPIFPSLRVLSQTPHQLLTNLSYGEASFEFGHGGPLPK